VTGHDAELEAAAKAPSRVRLIRRLLVFALALSCAAFWIWSRYLVVKSPLGGPCRWTIECLPEAPRCMRADVDSPGVCSRPCEAPEDCAPGIRCIDVELDERDETGSYVKAGTCVPQAILDARKAASRRSVDGGVATAKSDDWLDVPEGAGVLEGELTMTSSRAGAAVSEKRWLVKGALVRSAESEAGKRRIVDAASARVFVVDDAKRTFSASVLGASGTAGDVTVSKTAARERVAERECEVWELVEKRARRRVCVVSGGAFVDPTGSLVPPWARELAVRSVFPFRVVETDARGDKEVARTEVTRFSARPLERALFAVPKSYRNVAAK
jgi:hypothetical protein